MRPDEEIHSPRTHHFAERMTRIGTLTLSTPGAHALDLRADFINPEDPAGLCVGELLLVPVATTS